MNQSEFFTTKELLEFAGAKQRDLLERWLVKQGIPYLLDAKGNPKVRYASVEKRFKKADVEEEKLGFAPVHEPG